MSARVEKGKRWFKFVLMLLAVTAVVKIFFALGSPNSANKFAIALVQFIGGVIVLGLPAFLLGWVTGPKDERSPNEPGGHELAPLDTSFSAPAADDRPRDTSARSTSSVTDASPPDEKFWAAALAEFDSPLRRPGLWASAFAETDGNESRAKAIYLRHRARELHHEHQRQQAELKHQAELARMTEEQRAYASLPKGTCANCEAVIPIASEQCSKCGAAFGPGSTWRITPLAGSSTP
ncbi:MAG TPA: hypothetical protein VHP37_20540 [Burkholderiales bacterium]|nr:hypothetical protein [Burkholderiales bacterium]